MLQNVILQWAFRRLLEVGGLGATLVTFYLGMPPEVQAAIGKVFSGDWQSLSIGALIPVGVALWGYIWSFRSTTKPHVTADNKQVSIKDLPVSTQTKVKVDTQIVAQQKPTLLDVLSGLFKH